MAERVCSTAHLAPRPPHALVGHRSHALPHTLIAALLLSPAGLSALPRLDPLVPPAAPSLFYRGPIEVNYREEKGTLVIAQAQLWNPIAVPKQPPLVVAAYRALMLSALKVFGAERGKAHAQLPKWRRRANRPSCLDQVTLLRQEATQHPQLVKQLGIQPSSSQFVAAAAA
ncbi:MAG TPA: hypothetical protein VMX16_16725 [Terriglobia bacterium]|nr:hypothetical protein [Terriglobia bacterium]